MSISISKLYNLCKLANIKCSKSESTTSIKNKINKYLNKYKYAPRYLRGLTLSEKFNKKFEIRYYKLKEKYGKISKKSKYSASTLDKKYSNKKSKRGIKSKKLSKYTKNWNKKYKTTSLEGKSKISGVPLSILKQVYNRGLAAWRGGSHRPGASQHQWGVSRVNSFLTCGKTWYYPDHKLAQQAMNKSPKVRKFWSKKNCIKSKMGKRTKSR